MASVSSSSSPSVTMERFTYDVYLSFRGKDTRLNFCGNLWKALEDRGIHTFMDDKELQAREEITSSLVKAIEGSRIAIVVLSENYAHSSWCLQELSMILDCMKEKSRSVWPVFYDVDPSQVRNLTGTYGEAMAKHEARSNDNRDRLQKWKEALHQVANLSGFHYNRQGYEYEFIGRIVQVVSKHINRASLHVADYPVGLDSRLEEVCSLLELGSYDERDLMLGIYGMLGIGKTTLARAVYNRIEPQFESSCFLHGVRENSNKHGLVHLQNIMLSKIVGENDIQIENVNQGVSIIKHRLHRKKVLLVLDDVDKLEQLEALVGGHDWFGFGSRVIITTRDRHLLVFHGVERIYEVQALNHKDALQLLSHKAFKNGNVDPNCTEILNRVVTYASGLPLALEVIGSCLFGRSTVDEWENAFDRIERIPHNDIQSILKTSFDAFEIEEQSVFLDIACCFKGYELTEVQDILCAHYGQNVKSHIQLLIDKSLVSISLDGKVTLHPLIEDMGKEIVRQESPIEPGKRSRLWHPKDVVRVLEANTGTNKIEIIHLDSPLIEDEEVKWDGEAFKKMANLRTLIVRKCNFSEAPKHLPNSLRVLEWPRFPSLELPSDFDPKQLDICKLSNMEFMSSKLAELLKISCEVPKASQRSGSVPKDSKSSQSDAKDSESSPSVAEQGLQSSQTTGGGPNEPFADFWGSLQDVLGNQMFWWKLLACVSNAFGLICYGLSPSFNCLIGGRNFVKIIVYCVIWVVTFAIIFFAKKRPNRFVPLKIIIRYVVQVVVIPVYSFYYEKAVDGKPEILSLLSNAAFAMVSLSLSKLYGFGFEIGMFSYFLSCLAVQLFTIKPLLILVAIFFNSILFTLYSYPPEDVIQGLLTHPMKLGLLLAKMGHLHNPGPNMWFRGL